MTRAVLLLRRPHPRTARRADSLLATLLVAAVAGLVAVSLAIVAAAPASRPAGTKREAVLVFSAAGPHAPLEPAHAAGAPGVAVPGPRTRFEAAVNLRCLAASGYDRVAVAGP